MHFYQYIIPYRKIICKMKSLQNCGLLICQTDNERGQEQSQQQLSQHINIAQKEKNKKSIHHHQNDSSYKPKEVFSFKHNGFRNNSPSDMIRPLPLQEQHKMRQENERIQSYRSIVPQASKDLKQIVKIPPNFRLCNSPNAKNPIYVSNTFRSQQKTAAPLFKSSILKLRQPPIMHQQTYRIPNYEILDIKSKQSQATEVSWKKSQVFYGKDQIKQPYSSNYYQSKQIRAADSKIIFEKCSSTSSLPAFASFNGTKSSQSIKITTNNHLQDNSPSILFIQKSPTLHTIVHQANSQSRLSQNIIKQANDRYQHKEVESKERTQKNFGKQKRKTAFFAFPGLGNQTQRTLIEQLNEQQYKQSKNSPRERQECPTTQKQQLNFKNCKVRKPFFASIKNYTSPVKYQEKPSLLRQLQTHTISLNVSSPSSVNSFGDQNTKRRVNFQSSIKEITQLDGSSSPRFKNVKTIQSIGGQSLYSQNSHIDLKFRQKMKEQRMLVNLV